MKISAKIIMWCFCSMITFSAQAEKVLRVATYTKMPPFAYIGKNHDLVGIDIDVIKSIAKHEGYTLKFAVMPWNMLFGSVVSGENDLAIAGISYSHERAEKYGLSKSYLFVPAAIMYSDWGQPVKGLEDLKGKVVSGIRGAKQVKQMQDLGGAKEIFESKSIFLSFREMALGNVDAIFEDMQVLEYLKKTYPEYPFEIVAYEDEKVPESQQVIMVKKDNIALLAMINRNIDRLIKSGEMKKIEERWLGMP